MFCVAGDELEDIIVRTDAITLNTRYPSDKANFSLTPTAAVKRQILDLGPCQPPALKAHYVFKNSTQTTQRTWLCFSPKLKVSYCQACWLFKDGTANTIWAQGKPLDGKHGIKREIEMHQTSTVHRNSIKNMVHFKASPIDIAEKKKLDDETRKWIKVLDSVVSVVLTMAKMNIAFRGHRETIGDGEASGSNFLDIINLLARFVIKAVLRLIRKSLLYTPQIFDFVHSIT